MPAPMMTTTADGTMMMVTDDGTTMKMNESMMTTMMPRKQYMSQGGFEDKTNILGLVVFSCLFGAIVGRMGEQGEPLKVSVNSLMEAIMRLVGMIIW